MQRDIDYNKVDNLIYKACVANPKTDIMAVDWNTIEVKPMDDLNLDTEITNDTIDVVSTQDKMSLHKVKNMAVLIIIKESELILTWSLPIFGLLIILGILLLHNSMGVGIDGILEMFIYIDCIECIITQGIYLINYNKDLDELKKIGVSDNSILFADKWANNLYDRISSIDMTINCTLFVSILGVIIMKIVSIDRSLNLEGVMISKDNSFSGMVALLIIILIITVIRYFEQFLLAKRKKAYDLLRKI